MADIPQLQQILEGAILAADKPLGIDHMISLFELDSPTRADVIEALEAIAVACEGRGFELKEVASGYRFQVRSEYGEWVGRLWEEKPARYTRALLETLALIAYKQPITRGDIEEIRGVSVSTNIIRSLLEREWIRIVGHRDVPGRPAIYATTRAFLDYFDLKSLDQLPTLSEIKDLDKVYPELNLESELIVPRTLSLDGNEESEAEVAGTDDETLSEVTDRVNEISENIKNLFKEDDEADLDDDDEDSDVGTSESVASEAETVVPEDSAAGKTDDASTMDAEAVDEAGVNADTVADDADSDINSSDLDSTDTSTDTSTVTDTGTITDSTTVTEEPVLEQPDDHQADSVQADAPQADAPQAYAPRTDEPQAYAPRTDAPRTNAPQPDDETVPPGKNPDR